MSYTGKQPDFEVVVIKESSSAPAAPTEGVKLFIDAADGLLYMIDSEGDSTPVGGGGSKALTFFLS